MIVNFRTREINRGTQADPNNHVKLNNNKKKRQARVELKALYSY
jgi:hypothetical protein